MKSCHPECSRLSSLSDEVEIPGSRVTTPTAVSCSAFSKLHTMSRSASEPKPSSQKPHPTGWLWGLNISACNCSVQDLQRYSDLKSCHLWETLSCTQRVSPTVLALSPQSTLSVPTVSPSPPSRPQADFRFSLTLEEPNLALGILKSCIHRAGQSLPVPRRQSRIPRLQPPTAQPPHKACLEEEELATDGGNGIKGSLADIWRGFRLGWDRGGRKEHTHTAATRPAGLPRGQ